jgi:membrane protease YdiL (CAAX protease family)
MKRQVFIVWFLIFLIWAFYRAYFHFPEWVDELLVKPLVFVLPVFLVVLIKEKKGLSELGLRPAPRTFFTDMYIGVVIGIFFALEGLLVNYLKYAKFSFTPLASLQLSGGVVGFLFINFATSLWEEILGRGYMYKRLFETTNNQFKSAATSSFLFLLLHIPIMFVQLRLMGPSLIVYPVSIMILGITNCYLFSIRGSLTLPILLHLFWNMTVALYL